MKKIIASIFISFMSLTSFAQSISNIDIVVRETILSQYPYNPITGQEVQWDQIGAFSFESSLLSRCKLTIKGYIFEVVAPFSQPNVKFTVCLKAFPGSPLTGEVLTYEIVTDFDE